MASSEITFEMTNEELEQLQHAFERYDKNGDGKLSKEEIADVLKSLGAVCSDQSIQELITEIDTNKDGFVDFEEFCLLQRCANSSSRKKDDLVAAFQLFDMDNDGYITAKELHAVMLSMGDRGSSLDECRKMINKFDKNGDGRVDLQEFEAMMKDMCS